MLLQASPAFKNDSSAPLFSGALLMDIEDHAGGHLPFDLVVYLLNFAQ